MRNAHLTTEIRIRRTKLKTWWEGWCEEPVATGGWGGTMPGIIIAIWSWQGWIKKVNVVKKKKLNNGALLQESSLVLSRNKTKLRK